MTTAGGRRTGGRFGIWLERAGSERAWVNALIAFFVGAVFGVLLRNLTVAGLETGQFLPFALLTVVVAALGFGSLGRIFTRKRTGWLLALTALPWAAVAGLATFVVFSRQGNFEPFNPTVPVASGVVAVIAALLPYRGVPRIVGLIAVVLVVIAAVLLVAIAP